MRRLPLVLATFIVLSGHLVAADTPPEGVTPVVREITGAEGRTFRSWVSENADAFR